MNNQNFGTIKSIYLFNLFIPRWFTPVISNFFDESKDIENELHFNLKTLKSGGKKIVFSVFIILCVVSPGIRLIDSIENFYLNEIFKGLLYLNGIFAIYELGAGSLEVFNYSALSKF